MTSSCLEAWAETLSLSFAEHNIAVVETGGDGSDSNARARSETLERLSAEAPFEHLIVIDRNERPKSEVDRLQNHLGDRLHVLAWRELENYLLVPRALREALAEKHATDAEKVAMIATLSDDAIAEIIGAAADGLFDLILGKRVLAELGGIGRTLLSQETVSALWPHVARPHFARVMKRHLSADLATRFTAIDINSVVREQRSALTKEWGDQERRRQLALGAELLEAAFVMVGSRFQKTKDGPRIAAAMRRDEIPPEIADVIGRIVIYAQR